MMLLSRGRIVKKYKISLGGNSKGPKVRAGDGKTPEGIYVIDSRNPRSCYHLSLHISYPNFSDSKRAKQLGVSPGGDIMIHGIRRGFGWLGPLHRLVNWTKGCIAVTNKEIEEIWRAVPNGTQIEIRP
jgi:murein L,D-transpeptidase YafK